MHFKSKWINRTILIIWKSSENKKLNKWRKKDKKGLKSIESRNLKRKLNIPNQETAYLQANMKNMRNNQFMRQKFQKATKYNEKAICTDHPKCRTGQKENTKIN